MKNVIASLVLLFATPAFSAEIINARLDMDAKVVQLDLRYVGGQVTHAFTFSDGICAAKYPPACFVKLEENKNGDTGTEVLETTVTLALPVTIPGSSLSIQDETGKQVKLEIPRG